MTDIERTPVLVVGGGPVGLAIASDLGWRGDACTLIEKGDGVVIQPKMCLVGVRTMEFCRRWGMADWVEFSPYPRDYGQDYVYVTSLAHGYELAREPFPTRAEEPRPPQSPQKRERTPQTIFDPLMQKLARSFDTVTIHHFTELVALDQSDDVVAATVRDNASGETRTIVADYVVGCDGASSRVREILGITMTGDPTLSYTTHVLIRSKQFGQVHDKGEAYRFLFIDENGTWLTITSVNGDDLWRMQIIGSKEKSKPSDAEIRASLLRAVGTDIEFEIVDVMPWVRRELAADHYGAGRVFIAGDAAHLMSPTGAFGMNTGMGDAVDLGWKLDAVLRGWGGSELLDSYELERHPVAVRNMTEATHNLRLMLTTRDRRPPANLLEDTPEAETARREYGQWYADIMKNEWHTIGVNLGYRYDASPLVWPDGTPQPPNEISTYTQTARPGARAPHAYLSDGRSTIDLFGRGFVLLRFDPSIDVDPLSNAAASAAVPFEVVDIDDPEIAKLYERALVLVRPDGHVAWRADELDHEATELVDRVRGATKVAANS